jgi:hypothetical protein
LGLNGLKIERQKIIPIFYKGIKLDAGHRDSPEPVKKEKFIFS